MEGGAAYGIGVRNIWMSSESEITVSHKDNMFCIDD